MNLPEFNSLMNPQTFTYEEGYSLRDLFALEAMKILLTRSSLNGYALISEMAYGMADGMLAARDKSSEDK